MKPETRERVEQVVTAVKSGFRRAEAIKRHINTAVPNATWSNRDVDNALKSARRAGRLEYVSATGWQIPKGN